MTKRNKYIIIAMMSIVLVTALIFGVCNLYKGYAYTGLSDLTEQELYNATNHGVKKWKGNIFI